MSSTHLLAIAIAFAVAVPAHADAPTVSIIQARKLALARVPGTIVNEKLKTKKHGSIWSIKIQPRGTPESSGHLVKVEVDATNAAILKVKDVKARKRADVD
jgi:uncharacterized membrane protein YkoI